MKNEKVLPAIILAVGLVLAAAILSSGLKSFGRSVERGCSSLHNGLAASRTSVSIPSSLSLSLRNGSGPFEVKSRAD